MSAGGYLNVHRKFPAHPDRAVHAFMEGEAARHARGIVLRVEVTYFDGSHDPCYERFLPATKPVPYRTADGELWHVDFDTAKWNGGWMFDFQTLSRKTLLHKVTEYIGADAVSVKLVQEKS
jgi:hypothetical protein